MRKKVEQLEDLHSVHHVSSCMLSVAWKDPRVHLMPSFHYLQILNCLLIQRSTFFFFAFSSAQFSHSVMSDSLRPHESQHVRPPCPSPPPRVHSNSHPAISSSVIPFFSHPQSLPASKSFPMSQLFA